MESSVSNKRSKSKKKKSGRESESTATASTLVQSSSSVTATTQVASSTSSRVKNKKRPSAGRGAEDSQATTVAERSDDRSLSRSHWGSASAVRSSGAASASVSSRKSVYRELSGSTAAAPREPSAANVLDTLNGPRTRRAREFSNREVASDSFLMSNEFTERSSDMRVRQNPFDRLEHARDPDTELYLIDFPAAFRIKTLKEKAVSFMPPSPAAAEETVNGAPVVAEFLADRSEGESGPGNDMRPVACLTSAPEYSTFAVFYLGPEEERRAGVMAEPIYLGKPFESTLRLHLPEPDVGGPAAAAQRRRAAVDALPRDPDPKEIPQALLRKRTATLPGSTVPPAQYLAGQEERHRRRVAEFKAKRASSAAGIAMGDAFSSIASMDVPKPSEPEESSEKAVEAGLSSPSAAQAVPEPAKKRKLDPDTNSTSKTKPVVPSPVALEPKPKRVKTEAKTATAAATGPTTTASPVPAQTEKERRRAEKKAARKIKKEKKDLSASGHGLVSTQQSNGERKRKRPAEQETTPQAPAVTPPAPAVLTFEQEEQAALDDDSSDELPAQNTTASAVMKEESAEERTRREHEERRALKKKRKAEKKRNKQVQ